MTAPTETQSLPHIVCRHCNGDHWTSKCTTKANSLDAPNSDIYKHQSGLLITPAHEMLTVAETVNHEALIKHELDSNARSLMRQITFASKRGEKSLISYGEIGQANLEKFKEAGYKIVQDRNRMRGIKYDDDDVCYEVSWSQAVGSP